LSRVEQFSIRRDGTADALAPSDIAKEALGERQVEKIRTSRRPFIVTANPRDERSCSALSADIPLVALRHYQRYFNDRRNAAQMQVADEMADYTWQNMSRFHKTAMVLRDGPISELDVKLDPTIGEIEYECPAQSKETVGEHFEESWMDGLLVIHRGTIVYETYKTMREYDKHNWFSAGQLWAGALIALLADEGRLDVAMPASLYLPELRGSVWDSVTVEEALDMATGLDCIERDDTMGDSSESPWGACERWAAAVGLREAHADSRETPIDVLRSMTRRKAGLASLEPSAINTFVLELMVEGVTGKPMNEVLAERIWRKIGAQADAFIGVTQEGYPMSGVIMSSNLRDMARFALIFSPSWSRVSKDCLIADSILDKIHWSGRSAIYTQGKAGQNFQRSFPNVRGLSNRYQWDIVFPDGDLFKGGTGGQGLYISRARDVVVAYFCTGHNQEEILARAIAQSFPIL